MNELQIFSNEVIPVYTTDTGEKVVLGRELHESLKINTPYHKWFPRMCEYGFIENEDYGSFVENSTKPSGGEVSDKNVQNPSGGRPSTNHILKLDMAKHIAMIQRTPEGKAIRDKLIQLETNVSNLSPELRLLINLEMQQKQQAAALEAVNKRLDNTCELISLRPDAWREDCRKLIVRIAQARGGNEYIRDTQAEIYDLLNHRFAVDLDARLRNARRRMADDGMCKSKRERFTKVDVIAQDKKLIEGYIAIIKEMSIKAGLAN